MLESALTTFARNGFRRTSMNDVAAAAGISRPGLYFLFASKEALFRAAAGHVLAQDLAAIERVLVDGARPLGDRIVDAFDRWAGRWIGPGVHDVPAVVAENPALLDDTARAAPEAFEALLATAVTGHVSDPHGVVQTLTSVSVGLKHQVDTREEHRRRLATAVDLVLRPALA